MDNILNSENLREVMHELKRDYLTMDYQEICNELCLVTRKYGDGLLRPEVQENVQPGLDNRDQNGLENIPPIEGN
jgi:hypothetical protein